jgi:hypothetical protein
MAVFFIILRHNFWLFCFLAGCCFVFEADAQSGRKKKPVVVEQSPVVESQKSETEESRKNEPLVKISSLKLVAKLEHDAGYFYSTDFKDAVKDLEIDLRRRYRFSLTVEREEKMKFEEAKELAKKETDTYVLWVGFVASKSSSGVMFFDYAQYAILKPQTAEFVAKGTIKPRLTELGNIGGIPQLPGKRRPSLRTGIKLSIRQLLEIFEKGGWFE